jgi:Kae1-associated kinase Bud32
VDRLFHSALKRRPEERAAFLAKACGTDEAVRQKVEALIAAHEQSGEFLDTPAFEVATSKLPLDRADSLVNRIVDHYKILGALGAGGMGEVYLAQDTRLGRKIALKVLPREFTTDADRVRRFEQEARAASALSHPNVCVIHEIGDTEDGRRFITMEYIEGTTLRQQLAQKRLTLMEALDVAIQIASGLAVAHAAGIVHRDIKPENVMLRDDGLVKVLDFGLAKLTQQTTETDTDTEALMRSMVNTGSGMIMGTVAYMSPEQARGLAVDLRTDIWSLGVLLYEMIAGRAPFVGATPSDMLVSILEREPPTIAGDTLEVPAELERPSEKIERNDIEQQRIF